MHYEFKHDYNEGSNNSNKSSRNTLALASPLKKMKINNKLFPKENSLIISYNEIKKGPEEVKRR